MSKKWYNNDWVVSMCAVLAWIAAIVGNYFYHGGRVVW